MSINRLMGVLSVLGPIRKGGGGGGGGFISWFVRARVIVRGEWSGGGGRSGNWSQRAAFRMNGGGGGGRPPPRTYAGSGADAEIFIHVHEVNDLVEVHSSCVILFTDVFVFIAV